jgi:hypothetical protein
MKTRFTFVVMLLLIAGSVSSIAQAPEPSGKVPQSRSRQEFGSNEIFVGFLYQPTDWWLHHDLSEKGLELSYTRLFSAHLGAVADFDYAKNSDQIAMSSYAFRFGPRVNILNADKRFVPYAQFLIGGGHLSVGGRTTALASGFSYAGGGGVDARVTRHFGVNVQTDITRFPSTTNHSIWNRYAFGGVWRF